MTKILGSLSPLLLDKTRNLSTGTVLRFLGSRLIMLKLMTHLAVFLPASSVLRREYKASFHSERERHTCFYLRAHVCSTGTLAGPRWFILSCEVIYVAVVCSCNLLASRSITIFKSAEVYYLLGADSFRMAVLLGLTPSGATGLSC